MAASARSARAIPRGRIHLAASGGADGGSLRARAWHVCFMRAIITAAGRGSRLAGTSDDTPKTLLRFGSGTILSGIMQNFAAAGISEFIVIVGFRGEAIVEYLTANRNLGYAVTVVTNPEWQRGNGISVHLASTALDPDEEEVLLSMSDHLVSPAALRAMIDAPPGRNQLLV